MGSKAIRYRPSHNHKLCELAFGEMSSDALPSSLREVKVFAFRGKYGCKAET